MEKVCRFPLLRLKPSDTPPPFVIPAKAGIQRRANGKTRGKPRRNAQSNGTPRIWIPAFAGMTKERACFGSNVQNSSKATHRFFQRTNLFFFGQCLGHKRFRIRWGVAGTRFFSLRGALEGKGALEFYDQTGQTRLVARARFGVIGVFAETASRRVLTCRGKSALVAFVASRFPAGKPEGPGRLRKRDRTRFGLEGAWFSAPTRTRF